VEFLLREFVAEAVKGKLKHLSRETARINRLMEEDSEKMEAAMWR